MTEVIDLSTFKNQPTSSQGEKIKGGELTELLKKATILRQSAEEIKETIALLVEIGSRVPESWFAVDYFVKAEAENKPEALKQGANICFLVCAVFPPRGQIRCMKLEDYEAIGKGLYYNYYGQTGTVVAYFMSQKFQPMAEITKECIKRLK